MACEWQVQNFNSDISFWSSSSHFGLFLKEWVTLDVQKELNNRNIYMLKFKTSILSIH